MTDWDWSAWVIKCGGAFACLLICIVLIACMIYSFATGDYKKVAEEKQKVEVTIHVDTDK